MILSRACICACVLYLSCLSVIFNGLLYPGKYFIPVHSRFYDIFYIFFLTDYQHFINFFINFLLKYLYTIETFYTFVSLT